MSGEQGCMLAKGDEGPEWRLRFATRRPWYPGLCYMGTGRPKPGHIGSRTSASRTGLDGLVLCLVSKMVPGIQSVLRKYLLNE